MHTHDSFGNAFPAVTAILGHLDPVKIHNATHINNFVSYLRQIMTAGGLVEWQGDRAFVIYENYTSMELVLNLIRPVEPQYNKPQSILFSLN